MTSPPSQRLDPKPPKRLLGIMQGRLSPRPPQRLQAFPTTSWNREFDRAQELDLDGIEWIYEFDCAEKNPIATTQGREEIRETIRQSGTSVLSVCGDYFMRSRLSDPGMVGRDAAKHLQKLIAWSREVGARRILLPWLEEAALDSEEKRKNARTNIAHVLRTAEEFDIVLGLEMEEPGPIYRQLIEEIGHPLVRAYYDTGNSTAQGFDISQDIHYLRDRLDAIHIKDRVVFGSSQRLGQGTANFRDLFARLEQWQFQGDLVLQHYFEDPLADAGHAVAFVRSHWPRQREAA